MAISQEIAQPSVIEIILKIDDLKFCSNPPGTYELSTELISVLSINDN